MLFRSTRKMEFAPDFLRFQWHSPWIYRVRGKYWSDSPHFSTGWPEFIVLEKWLGLGRGVEVECWMCRPTRSMEVEIDRGGIGKLQDLDAWTDDRLQLADARIDEGNWFQEIDHGSWI